MPIPKFQETFIPILTILSNGRIISTANLKKGVFDKFYKNVPEILDRKTKSGDFLIFNRIAWGKAYLKQAGMLAQPARALVQITDKGMSVLENGELNLKSLLKDSEFLANRNVSKGQKEVYDISNEETPEDLIDKGFSSIESQIKIELLSKLRDGDPYNFEVIVLKLLKEMGYGDFIRTPKSGDGGIDGIVNEDKLGLDKIYIQAKRYADGNKVREGDIRNFIGAISGDANKGVFVTTSTFDEKAIQKAKNAPQKIILINGDDLVGLMYEYNIGVQVKISYDLKEIDGDFFEED